MEDIAEQLAIIKNIGVGMRDTNTVICFFNVKILHGESLQIVSLDTMREMIMEGSVYKLEDLNGRACVVTLEKGICKYKKLC